MNRLGLLAVVIAVCVLLLSGFAAEGIFGDGIETRDDLWWLNPE